MNKLKIFLILLTLTFVGCKQEKASRDEGAGISQYLFDIFKQTLEFKASVHSGVQEDVEMVLLPIPGSPIDAEVLYQWKTNFTKSLEVSGFGAAYSASDQYEINYLEVKGKFEPNLKLRRHAENEYGYFDVWNQKEESIKLPGEGAINFYTSNYYPEGTIFTNGEFIEMVPYMGNLEMDQEYRLGCDFDIDVMVNVDGHIITKDDLGENTYINGVGFKVIAFEGDYMAIEYIGADLPQRLRIMTVDENNYGNMAVNLQSVPASLYHEFKALGKEHVDPKWLWNAADKIDMEDREMLRVYVCQFSFHPDKVIITGAYDFTKFEFPSALKYRYKG